MRVSGIHFILPSNQPEQSLQFYVEGLFFKKISEFPRVGLWTVALGDFQVSFVRPEDASLVARPGSRYFLFGIWIDSIQDYYSRVQATGLVQIEHHLDGFSEAWQFSVIDNNGYRIGFNQKVPVSRA